MTWVKIEIEFQPETHDPNEVMAFLLDHFTNDAGVPTATVTLSGFGPEPAQPDPLVVSAKAPYAQQLPPPSQANLVRFADDSWKVYKGQKITAIKDLRSRAALHGFQLGLKEAKDAIDGAARRNP